MIGLQITHVDSVWTPAQLPNLQATLIPSLATLWQDAGMTTRALSDGDPVRVAVCPFTKVAFTSPSDSARPVLHNDGAGHWYLSFDGVDDQYASTGTAIPPGAVSAFCAMYPTDLSVNRTMLGNSAASGGPFWFIQGADKKVNFFCDNVTALPGSNTALTANSWYLAGYTYGSSVVAHRLNQAPNGGGTGGTTFTATADHVGDIRSGSRFVGRIAGLVWGTAQWSASDIAKIESYLRALYP